MFSPRLFARSKRMLHQVPSLANGAAFAARGIDGLYSPAGFRTAWLEYQKYLTAKLSLATVGTENESRSPYQILMLTAKQTTQQHVFHYALQAHNNHFFFEQLADRETAQKTKPLRFLMERLADQNIGSVDELRAAVAARVDAALGQGWVFLVERADKLVELVTCHNDGTPYYYGKNQALDLNGAVDEASFDALQAVRAQAEAGELDFTLPLLAVSFWDVAYAPDYGVCGKSEYVARVWDCINWDVVNKRMFQI